MDQEFSVTGPRGFGTTIPISDDHIIQNFPAGETVVGVEKDLPRIIL